MARHNVIFSFLLVTLIPLVGLGQGKYRVGLCPGSVQAYRELAETVDKITGNETKATNDLIYALMKWKSNNNKLTRFQVAIHYPDKRVRFWRLGNNGEATFFAVAASTAAGRGDLNTQAKPGDSQRCFFQDTTVVLDTLRIPLGNLNPDTRFTLTVNEKNHALPLNADRTELLLYAGMLPELPAGRYLPATVTMVDEVHPVTFYFLSVDDRAQLVRSLRDWTSNDSPACTELPDELVSFLTQNWGGKQCVSPALYNSALRRVAKNLLRAEKISCEP
ncbi:hypothetical protein IC229_27865 [Spirosoma sp. BT702]|uniref:Uncharacterized protein n=1 Tax=Spirosoma profusum TaxID=2771354 RepID=A0A927APG9_9BACT|nr:hypothetical protein [Spirosoma profusum]MBD2704489.1 hypothetical protein [Spirosoma profusum]